MSFPKATEDQEASKWLRRTMVILVAVFPLVFIPGIENPFSSPKLILLLVFVGICAIFTAWKHRIHLPIVPIVPKGFLFSFIAWVFVLAISALSGEFVSPEILWLSLLCAGWFWLVVILRPDPVQVAVAVAISCAITAVIVLLQYLNLDPFRLLGWTTPTYRSPRMRVFGTLGNPNFVAAFLIAGIPLTIYLGKHIKSKALYVIVIALEAAAIFATGSRSVIPALIAVLVWLGLISQFAHWRLMAAVGLIILIVIPFMPSRPLMDTIHGRIYIWKVATSQLTLCPVFGFGPGAFEPKFIEWETAYWRDGHGSDDQRKFSGLQAHAHNDFLEVYVNNGLAGLLSWLMLLGSFLVFAFQKAKRVKGGFSAWASAGIVALAAVSVVDFPLYRPAELFLFWTLMAVVYLEAGPEPKYVCRKSRQA